MQNVYLCKLLRYAHIFNEKLKSYILYSTALPNITKQPVSVTINVRSLNVVALCCSAIGMGPIYYRWEKYHLSNDSWIRPSHRAVSITSPTLRFSIIIEEDEGVYRCVVTNDDGSVISDNATIHVYGECSVIVTKYCHITCRPS